MGAEVSISLDGDVELKEIDVEVTDSTIAFELEGVIKDVAEETLAKVAGREVVPTELTLRIEDSPNEADG